MIRVELAGGRGHKAIGVVGAHQGQGRPGRGAIGGWLAGPTPNQGRSRASLGEGLCANQGGWGPSRMGSAQGEGLQVIRVGR